MITENLKDVEARVCAACERSGRKREDVTLIAVSKTKPVEMLEEAYAELIHSVDSIRLAETIDKEAAKKGIVANVLLEVNMAKEDTKFGLMPEEVMDFIHEIVRFQNIKVQGLMTIAPFVENPEENRIHFANLRKLSVDIAKEKVDNVNMSILSMGMTNDFEVAIEEGATMVRIGTAIFGERNYAHQI